MSAEHAQEVQQLMELGLTDAEAQIYVALASRGSMSAPSIVEVTELPKSSVYLTLASLSDRGFVEGGAGYGSLYQATSPDVAMSGLMERERAQVARRERVAEDVARRLSLVAEQAEDRIESQIEILSNPRVYTGRVEALTLGAEEEIEVFVKPPFLQPPVGNPAQKQSTRRGVRNRAIYEERALQEPHVRPYLVEWVNAGEEARVLHGDLPLKLLLFDRQTVLMSLETPDRRHGLTMLLIRHRALGSAFHALFDGFWAQAQPLADYVAEHHHELGVPSGPPSPPRKRSPRTRAAEGRRTVSASN